MRAVTYQKFGPPEVLQVKELEKPVPQDHEVLIRIYATTVEKEDPGLRKSPGLNGIIKPKRKILGMEFSGIIEEVGESVTAFKANDEVYGNTGMSMGTYAEYICVSEHSGIAIKPQNLNFEQACSFTNGGLTALPFLMEQGNITKNQKVLINGASGSVGSVAVQIAKYFKTEVTAVCSTKNMELVQSLGADKIIDYTRQDFIKTEEKYDIIFDVAGKSSYRKCKRILNPQGVFLTTVPTPAILFQMLYTARFGNKKVKFIAAGLRKAGKKAKDLNLLRNMIVEGNFKAVICKTYSLEQIADAHTFVENEKKTGSVVISIK